MAYKWGNRYGIDNDDALQLSYIGCWKALLNLDTDRPSHEQVSYIANSIQRELGSYARVQRRHWDNNKHVTLDTGLVDTLSESSFEDDSVNLLAVRTLLSAMKSNTRRYAMAIIACDMNICEAAKYLGVSHQSVSQQYAKIKKIIQEAFS